MRHVKHRTAPVLSGVGPAAGYCVALAPEARDRLRERLRAALPTDADGAILLAARAWAVRRRTNLAHSVPQGGRRV